MPRKFSISGQYISKSGSSFYLRDAHEGDSQNATDILLSAFEIWKSKGLRLSPMFQTLEHTASYLPKSGFMLEVSGSSVGTFALDKGEILLDEDYIEYCEGDSESISFSKIADQEVRPGSYLVFKRAAILPDSSHQGIGRAMLEVVEQYALNLNLSGMVVETVKEADWLYEWYFSLGYMPVGIYRYSNSQVDTVLMIKSFRG